MPITNIGSGEAHTVEDRKLPESLDRECFESARKGGTGKGLNKQTMNESLADFDHAPKISE